MTARPRRALALPFCLVALVCVVAPVFGCGGSPAALTHGTLPQPELDLLELVPRDAFFAGRLDLGALRQTPHWEAIQERLRAEEPALAELASEAGHAYFAVGGLVDAPPIPPVFDEEQNYLPPPPWASLARHYQGRIPKMVAIVEGGVARACLQATEGFEAHERGGYRVVDIAGVAVLTRGDSFCALTWTPLVDALLAEAGPTAAIASNLVTGAGGVARLALRLDTPALAELVADVDTQRPGADEEPLEVPEGLSDEDAEVYRQDAERYRQRERRAANFSRAVARIALQGLRGVSWQLSSAGDGFETRTQVVTDDDGRMTMWRELTEVYFDVMRALVSYEVLPGDAHPVLEEFVRSVRIEEQRGGYVIVRHTSHAVIARMLERAVPAPAEQYIEAVADPHAAERAALEERLDRAAAGSAEEAIAEIEPHLEFLRGHSDPNFRSHVMGALARAYGSRARFEDARALLEAEQEFAFSYRPEDPDETWRIDEARRMVCVHAAQLCELHLTQGNAELAQAAVRTFNDANGRACVQTFSPALSCDAAASAALGRADEGLLALEGAELNPSPVSYAASRMRILQRSGRDADVVTVARGMCVGGPASAACNAVAGVYAESLGLSTTRVESAEAAFAALRARHRVDAPHQDARETAVRVAAAECAMRARLAAATESTRAVCAQALTDAVAVHGEAHPVVAGVRLSYARALQAARQRPEAAAQREAAATIVDGLGPQHPLRAR